MSIRKIIISVLCMSVILSTNSVFARENTDGEEILTEHGTGLMMSEDVAEQFHSKIAKIVNVLPNEIALSRLEKILL